MPSRDEAPTATYGITPEALTFYVNGKPALVIDRRGFDGLMLRLMVAKMENA